MVLTRTFQLIIVGMGLILPTIARADSCSSTQVLLTGKQSRTPPQLLDDISFSLHTSILYEAEKNEYFPTLIQIPADQPSHTLSELISLIDPKGRLTCEIDTGFIHLFDNEGLEAKENPLNHTFAGFFVPQTARLFALAYKLRLRKEAFDGGAEYQAGSTGGGLSTDTSKAELTSEILTNITARAIFVKEAKQVNMVLVATFIVDAKHSPQASWALTRDELHLSVTQ